MKNRYLYIKISIIVAILLSIVLWIAFYFLPTNKYIYNSNQTIKELKRKITKYKRDKRNFHRTNLFEQKLMKNMMNVFNNKFYVVNNKEDMINFYRKIYDHIQHYEKKSGDKIIDLQITTENETRTFSRSNSRMAGMDKQKETDILLKSIPDIKEKEIKLDFTGELKNVLNFINHITWCDLYISIKNLEITKKFNLTIKVYYIDKRIERDEQ